MSYQWQQKPRYFENDDAAKASVLNVIDSETMDWHYTAHHAGYVTALNTIETKLASADPSAANGNYSEYGELKRRFTWNHAGALLHDIYWDVMGGDGDIDKAPTLKAALVAEYGSVDAWRAGFKGCCVAAKLSGWGVLTLDTLYSGRLLNVEVDEHHYGAVWGGIPLIPCDVFEHAYYHKDGKNRAGYVDNFLNHINWERVEERYTRALAAKQALQG